MHEFCQVYLLQQHKYVLLNAEPSSHGKAFTFQQLDQQCARNNLFSQVWYHSMMG